MASIPHIALLIETSWRTQPRSSLIARLRRLSKATRSAKIGNTGISLFEIRQVLISLGGTSASQTVSGGIELAATTTAAATLNLKGGRLIINGNVNRTNTTPGALVGPNPLAGLGAAPVVNLSGDVLGFAQSGQTANWQTDMTVNGSQLLIKQNAQGVVAVGDATHPGNFTMNAGSSFGPLISTGTP